MRVPGPITSDADASQLLLWASLNQRGVRQPASWTGISRMTEAAGGLLRGDAQELEELLRESSSRLEPLEDPFLADFGAHRWLSGRREENYSDWLEYAIRQMETPEQVFGLFGLGPPGVPTGSRPHIQRELPVGTGRLDLLIHYPRQALLVIEVKLVGAAAVDPRQLKAYLEWMAGQEELAKHFKHLVVVVTQSDGGPWPGVVICRWENLTIRLRRMLPQVRRRRGTVPMAMVLAFAGAVEQNLCGLPHMPLAALRGGLLVSYDRVATYLKEVLRA